MRSELDLLLFHKGKRYGMEIKFNERLKSPAPATALHDLELSYLWVIYPGDKTYQVEKRISVLPLQKNNGSCLPVTVARNHLKCD